MQSLEERLAPSWGSVPPPTAYVPSATLVRLDGAGDASGSAAIAANEVDWFKLVAPKTGSYTLRTDNAASGIDTVLAVYNLSGGRLAYNDDVSPPDDTSSALTLNLTAGLTYFFGITNYSGTPGGAYGWSVDGPTLEDGYEDNDTLETATDLCTVDWRYTLSGLGLMDGADWFKFTTIGTGAAGHSVSISFTNAQGNLNLYLYDAAGTLLAQSASPYNSETISLTGRAAGTYYVRVAGYNGATNAAYSLTIKPPLTDDAFENNDTFATAYNLGTLTDATTVNGLKMSDAADWFKFTTSVTGNAGSSVAINFSNAQGNLNLYLYNFAGYLLASSPFQGDTETISLSGRPAGTYFVRVAGYYGATNPSYSLTVTPSASGNWYTQSLADAAVRGLVETYNSNDGQLSRSEMLNIYQQVRADGTVSTLEFNDLRTIVNDTSVIGMSEAVRVLSRKVALANTANARYQGTTLGNLAAGDAATKLQKLVNKWFLGLDHPTAESDSTYAYAQGSLFGATIQYQDIAQGEVGDCYFLAGLGTVALHNNGAIRQMFTDNGDGTFTIRFYRSGVADYLTVDRYLPSRGGRFIYANMGELLSDGGNVLWVALAEKGYAQLNEAGGLGQEVAANSYISIEGGAPSDAVKQITGTNASFAWTTGLTFNTIRTRFDANSYITIGTRSTVANNIVPNHAYVMVGYDAAAQTVTLFNPWGIDGGWYNGSLRDGFVTLTMSQLLSNCDGWWYS